VANMMEILSWMMVERLLWC